MTPTNEYMRDYMRRYRNQRNTVEIGGTQCAVKGCERPTSEYRRRRMVGGTPIEATIAYCDQHGLLAHEHFH